MYYYLAVFRSRSETLYFANMLRSNGVLVSIINTPKEAGQTCGICVKFMPNAFEVAKKLFTQKPLKTFAGFYSVMLRNGGMELTRI